MAMAAWQHRPGIDTLMNQYAENTHAQFGNIRYCREVSSVAELMITRRSGRRGSSSHMAFSVDANANQPPSCA